jgi:hypothetical protein
VTQAAALRPWGRIEWPRDGRRKTLEGAGIALAEQYKAQGFGVMHEHAQFSDGSVSVQAGARGSTLKKDSLRSGDGLRR